MRSLVTSSSRMPRILGAAPALLLMLTLIHVNAWSQPGQPAAPQSSAPVIDVYIDHAWNTLRRSMQDCANPGRYQNNNGTGSLATAECRLSENGGPAAKRQHPGDCKSADVSCLPTALTSRYRLHTILPLLSKIQSDVRVRLGTTYEHVVRSGPLQRLGVISNRSVNQTGHAGMTDSNPARPSHRNIARFRHFK
jgi:hypothetical protein